MEEFTEESDLQDPLRIDFPKQIGRREARTLLKHLVFSMPGKCSLDLRTETGEHFGKRLRPGNYKVLDRVPVIPVDSHMSGVITDSSMNSAEFAFLNDYDERGRQVYKALRILFGAYDWDELRPEYRQLATNVRTYVQSYFR